MEEQKPKLLRVEIVAKRLKLTPSAVRWLCNKGRILGATQPCGKRTAWLVPEASLSLPEVKHRKLGRPGKMKATR